MIHHKVTMVFAVLFFVLFLGSCFATDPDVVELAKKEKARRSQITGKPKTFTNKDIEAFKKKNKDKAPAMPPPVEAPTQTQTQAAETKDEHNPTGFDYDKEKTYWRGRYIEVRDRIDKAQKEIDRLTPIVETMKNTYVTSNDSREVMRLQAEVELKTTELESAKIELTQANQAMEDLEEEGRQAGALPGWFRD